MSDIVERLQKWRANFGNMPGGRMLDEASAEIARLAAEVERHRMTPEERVVVADAADIVEAYDSTSDDPPSIGGQAIRNYLDRTAPEVK